MSNTTTEQAALDCARCSGSGEDPEGYFDQTRGPDGGTHDGPCSACGGSGADPAPTAEQTTVQNWIPFSERMKLAARHGTKVSASFNALVRDVIQTYLKTHGYSAPGWEAPAPAPAAADVIDPRLAPHVDLLTYVLQDDVHNRLPPRVIDIAYSAFVGAKWPNAEDGGPSGWFNDIKPMVSEAIDKLRRDLMEDRSKRAAQIEKGAAKSTD